ncbi:hypothetical protein UNSWCS_775 [Campylobacter concisus UNSWCS]|uniref:Uncharacterized protein n=1 Tax=Campylobacter concisus UNSWCS TaxID=1242968 RepID=U2FBC2_9BACT|nr:hypothetical protein UNSWCS_775 [Campylobacter concisus UNSWCS]
MISLFGFWCYKMKIFITRAFFDVFCEAQSKIENVKQLPSS